MEHTLEQISIENTHCTSSINQRAPIFYGGERPVFQTSNEAHLGKDEKSRHYSTIPPIRSQPHQVATVCFFGRPNLCRKCEATALNVGMKGIVHVTGRFIKVKSEDVEQVLLD